MMDNATFRENMNAVAVAASKVSTQANQANPSWFYWLGVVNSMRGFMLAAFIVAIIIVGVSLIVIPVNVKLIQDYCRS